jgi:hypothetical protein
MRKIAIFGTDQLSLKKSHLSIERPPHFGGKISGPWDVFPDAWEHSRIGLNVYIEVR